MIQISSLSKEFASDGAPVKVLGSIDLNVPDGSLFTLLGPSGCGKTTTLRCVAGLEKPSGGEIRLDQRVVYSSQAGVWVPAERRDVGMVFQSYAIWPHMTVIENVVYPLEAKRIGGAEKTRRAMDVLEKVGLAELARRPATRLSGGQQQRVALARALVARPQVLLFDEPLSNLDAKLREALRIEIVTLQKEFGITALYVTHDQEEALAISDRIAIMRDGEILEVGEPSSLYETPAHRFSAAFLGLANFVDGRVAATTGQSAEIATDIGTFSCRNPHGLPAGTDCHVFFRPECLKLLAPEPAAPKPAAPEPAAPNRMRAVVRNRMYLGHIVDVRFQVGNETLRAKIAPDCIPSIGDMVEIAVEPASCLVLPREAARPAQGAERAAA